MVPAMHAESRRDGMVTTICVPVFLLSTDPGSVFLMLAISVAMLAVVSILYRERLGRLSTSVMAFAAVLASLAAFAETKN